MIGGIALLGIVTATLASWLVDKVSAEDTKTQTLTAEHIELLHEEIKALRLEMAGAPRTQNSATPSTNEVSDAMPIT